MRLHGNTIYDWVDTVARQSIQFIIVSPFFSIDGQLKSLLTGIPNLQVIVGDEFSTNNPRPLRELSETASNDIKCIYKNQFDKRLHAKVFYSVEGTGRRRALVGSANFTVSGLTKNEERAVSFDSDSEIDLPILDQIKSWIDRLQLAATDIDWSQAIRQFEHSPNPTHQNEDFHSYLKDIAQNYWVLKTTEGKDGRSRWKEFVEERVVSIGWTDLVRIIGADQRIEPSKYTLPLLRAAAVQWERGQVRERRQNHAVKMLDWFCRSFSRGDRIIVCRGFAANQKSGVLLYGLAIVDGDTIEDLQSDWWLLKRKAVLLKKEIEIPRRIYAETLGKGSLLQTIHRISEEKYEAFVRETQKYG